MSPMIARLARNPGAWRWRAASAAAACALAACSSAPRSQHASASSVSSASTAPLQLALAPAALGCTLAVQQQLTVQPPGQSTQTLEALLEVDGQAVRLALFHLGQRMGSLRWDGQQLQTQLSRWWPAQLPPAQVLGDMQLALWPVSAIAQALPQGWTVQASGQGRRLAFEGQEKVAVQATGADAFEIRYAPAAWRLQVASPGGMQPCAQEPVQESVQGQEPQ